MLKSSDSSCTIVGLWDLQYRGRNQRLKCLGLTLLDSNAMSVEGDQSLERFKEYWIGQLHDQSRKLERLSGLLYITGSSFLEFRLLHHRYLDCFGREKHLY